MKFSSLNLNYEGGKALKSLSDSLATTGTVGEFLLYSMNSYNVGGQGSILDMVNQRLEANDMPQLPSELTTLLKPVEDTFDDETYKYINYKPNSTRTLV